MMEMIGAFAGSGSGSALLFFVGAFFVGAYFVATWDSRKAEGEEDGQIGLKVVLYTLALGALGVALGGVDTLLHYVVSGAKTGTPMIKQGAAELVIGRLRDGGRP